MNRLTLRLLLILSISSPLAIQGQVSNEGFVISRQVNTLNLQKPLQLTTSIINQRYCASNRLSLTLKLRYTNVGDQPLILFKFAKAIYQSLVSRSEKDARAKRYEQELDIFTQIIIDYSTVETPSPGPLFSILKPGESLEDEGTAGVYVNDGDPVNRKSLRPGNYFLEVRTSTWSSSPERAERLRNRWSQYGNFWSWDIKSLPMLFKIEEERRVVNCLPE